MSETRTPKQIAADRLDELIEILEVAKGPSLELDGMIWAAANGYEFVMWDGAGCVYRDPNAPNWNRGIQHADATTVRPYSASLDAAVALAERVLTRLDLLEITYQIGGPKQHCTVETEDGEFDGINRPTLPLAICLATLKSVRVHMHPRDREETQNG